MYITIDNFDELSAYDIARISIEHINKTKRPGLLPDGRCSYMAGCAASPFIKEEYHIEADALGPWRSIVKRHRAPDINMNVVEALQGAHDMSYNVANMDAFLSCWRTNMLHLLYCEVNVKSPFNCLTEAERESLIALLFE